MLAFDEEDDITITLTNLGLLQRPDLFDGHTLHWHGFVNAIPLFDGVPELSLAVPVGPRLHLLLPPARRGDVHVPLPLRGRRARADGHDRHGLRPAEAEQAAGRPATRSARSTPTTTATGRTRYDREFAFMITELWSAAHYRDAHIQVSDWTDYDPELLAAQRPRLPGHRSRPTATRCHRGAGGCSTSRSLAGHLQHRRAGAAADVEPRLPEPRDDGRQHRPARSWPRTPACSRGRDGTTNYLTTNTRRRRPRREPRRASSPRPAPGEYLLYDRQLLLPRQRRRHRATAA